MRWRGSPPGVVEAIGIRGEYRIRPSKRDRIGIIWVLWGTGYDGLPMLATGGEGRPFPTLTSAREFADRLDQVVHGEPMASGA